MMPSFAHAQVTYEQMEEAIEQLNTPFEVFRAWLEENKPPPPPPPPPVEPLEEEGIPVVYSRVPRTRSVTEVTDRWGAKFTITRPDIYDTLPEVARQRDGFSGPGQLVLLRNGEEVVLYDGMDRHEVPMDVMVSYDRKEALFSVYRTKGCADNWVLTKITPSIGQCITTGGYEAQLHRVLFDPPYTVTPLEHTPGTWDTGPVYLPGGGILYTSTKQSVYQPVLRNFGTDTLPIFRAWIRDEQGDRLVGPADMGGSLHPYVLKDGQVAIGQKMLNHDQPYRATNGGFNWPGTVDNMWWIASIDQKGGHWNNLYGAHVYLSALHFIGQLSDGTIMVTHYYRGNNFGGGEIFMWMPEPIDIEGAEPGVPPAMDGGGPFAPRTLTRMTAGAPIDWTNNGQDAPSRKINGRYTGKLRDPTGAPDNQAVVTFLRGRCSLLAGTPQSYEADLVNEPRGCDAGIYVTKQIPVTTPDLLEVVVDSPDWHEFAARVALPYKAIYGIDKPEPYAHETHDSGACALKMASMKSETTPAQPYYFGNFKACGTQGCELDGVKDEDVTAIRFWEAVPNAKLGKGYNSVDHIWGYVSRYLGDVPVQSDGSAYVELPCETPYVMAGVDKDGRVIKRDQVPQSLRQGEQRECTGCHQHSKAGPAFEGSVASTLPPTVLTASVPVPEWHADVKPFLEANCASCHAADGPLFDYERLVWDFKQDFRYDPRSPVNNRTDAKRFYLQRPNTSAYVSGDFARSSLLYWKCSGGRQDNHTDDQYPNDIDYGVEHPGIDCKLIADWIDSGAYRKKQ